MVMGRSDRTAGYCASAASQRPAHEPSIAAECSDKNLSAASGASNVAHIPESCRVVNHDRTDDEIVQQPAAVIEKADDQHQRREHRDADPIGERACHAKHEIAGLAVPG